MKKCLPVILLFLAHVSFGQNPNIKRAWHWYFGLYSGIDFSNGLFQADTNGLLTTPEGSSSISDTNGNLLCYTDGENVWNKNHVIMPNGTGLLGGLNKSSTQSSLIIPQPSSSNLFYLFTVDEFPGTFGMLYSIIDMNLDGGNGDVTQIKNIFLFGPCTEKLSAVNHCNDSLIWIVGHKSGNNEFYAYILGPGGINPIPVISSIGTSMDTTFGFNPTAGQLKFSPDGTMAANALYDFAGVELFNFDNFSGVFSNSIVLSNTEERNYGVEFSFNSQLLYNSNVTYGKLFQYDVSIYDSTLIVNSKTLIFDDNSQHGFGQMQLSPDGKIYLGSSTQLKKASVINYPDLIGLSCNFCDTCISLSPNPSPYHRINLGLPNFNCSYFLPNNNIGCPVNISDTKINNKVKVIPNPARDWIVMEGKGIKSVEIINALGSETGSYPTTASALENKLNISLLNCGIYFLKIKMINERFVFQKIIINK